jgi:Na+/H+ antiporter NhaD/arsenite permease-like protein
VAAIDFPTLFILFGLMILSAQFAESGFYDWCALRVSGAAGSPGRLLAVIVVVSGLLSAVLANDVVVFAMTPFLCAGLKARGLDPRPFLIALAGAANAGSAATIIGNPQNILIGQVGGLDFWRFLEAAAVPAVLGLLSVWLVVRIVWGRTLAAARALPPPAAGLVAPLDRAHLAKAVIATGAILALFTTDLHHEAGVLIVTGALLVSRRLATRRMLGMVDWHLLLLFACLFVITEALATTGIAARGVAMLADRGLLPESLAVLAPLALAGSNTIGNVPAVVLMLSLWPWLPEGALLSLAVLSTLAGNLFIVGSLANIIVVERARESGVVLGFGAHAACGVPMTALSFGLAVVWLAVRGYMPIS